MRPVPQLNLQESRRLPAPIARWSRGAWGLLFVGLVGALVWQVSSGAGSNRESTAGVLARGPESTKEPASEYELKAAYLLNFLKLTEWPEGSLEDEDEDVDEDGETPGPLTVVIVGADPFKDELDKTFEDQTAQGRSIQVVRMGGLPDEDEELEGHLVFCALSKAQDRSRLLKRLSGRPMMLVGERDGFADDGAHINFYLLEERVKFEVNVDSVKRSGLEVSATLLKLAKIVRDEEEESRN